MNTIVHSVVTTFSNDLELLSLKLITRVHIKGEDDHFLLNGLTSFKKVEKRSAFLTNLSFCLQICLFLTPMGGFFLKTESRKRVLFKQRCLKVYYTHVKILTKTDPFIFCRQANYIFEH